MNPPKSKKYIKENITIEKYYKNKLVFIEKEIKQIDFQLSNMPEGIIHVYSNNGSFRWFLLKNNRKSYLSKKDRKLAEVYAKKKYLLLRRAVLLDDRNLILNKLENYNTSRKELLSFLSNLGYAELLSNSENVNVYANEWSRNYKQNPFHPEQLIYPCPSGNYVRSKSEVFIDMALTEHGIPFRYEGELIIGTKTFYPDFTILNPENNTLIYWEHLGKMDDIAYVRKNNLKMKVYYENGIIPGKNLILTFETSTNPFTYVDAEAMVSMLKL